MERIGFIGLGTMGKPMARNLLKAGFPLVVHNRSRGAVDELAKEGATTAASPRHVAEQCSVAITMLPDSPDVEQVVAGENGLFSGARPGTLIIDMSTISPVTARRLAQQAETKGISILDAPVSGGEIGAINGTLSIMVGGKQEAFDRALPIFQAMGKSVIRIGDSGTGQITKAANQILVGLVLEAVCEALVFATKAGVDPSKVRQVLLGGLAQSRVLEQHGQKMIDRNFKPGFRIGLHHKDLGIALGAAQEFGAPLPLTAILHQMMNALLASGKGDMDNSALVTLIESLAQTQVSSSLAARKP